MPTRLRRGFTLIELLVSIAILGIISGASVKLLLSQNRYYDHETNVRVARGIARSASNVLLADLRMVQDSGGVDSVLFNGKLIRVLVPYRYGIVCGTHGNTTVVSMLPVDWSVLSMASYRGFAYRTPAGRYTYVSQPTVVIPSGSATPLTCTGTDTGQAQVRTVTVNGRIGDVLDATSSAPSGATVGSMVFFWQRITYSFRTSAVYPSRLGLWRNVEGGLNEELLAPFDTSARFRFYRAGDDTSLVSPPALSDIRGVDLVLSARSPRSTAKDSASTQLGIVTSIFFKNVRAF